MRVHLVYYNWQLVTSFYGIMIDHIEEILQNKNNKVILLTCDGEFKNCMVNRLSDNLICSECRYVKKIGLSNLKKYENRFVHLEIGEFVSDKERNEFPQFTFNTVEEVKKIKYREVYLGYGALSSYVSYTRNQSPDFSDKETLAYFTDLLDSQMVLTDAIYKVLDEYMPEKMNVYNGRWAEVRPMYDIAKATNIQIDVLEALNDLGTTFYKEIYPNVLPQNIPYRHQWIMDIWEMAEKDADERNAIAESFFMKRRNAEFTGDVKIYTLGQKEGLLPEGWDSRKRNMVIFNSSEDEFLALGNDYDTFALFDDQETGIHYLLKEFATNTNVHFYLRIHPNLAALPYGYHVRLLGLERRYSNVTVIPGDSAISTYSLIDSAEKVIAFTSTVGAEACYWGKPVILLAGTGYYYLDVAYIPKSKEETKNLILEILEPKEKLGALKYAFFLMDKFYRTTKINRNPQAVKIFGKDLGSKFSHLKLLNSSMLFRVCWQVWVKMVKPLLLNFSKSKYKLIPVKEKILSDD